MTGHTRLPLSDLGWQATGYTSPPVYRVDVTCECGKGSTITAPAGPEVAFAAAEAWHPWHLRIVDLEERLVLAFSGLAILPGSPLRLTERAAQALATIALGVIADGPYDDEEDRPRDA